jgi:hypothetical protein
MGEFRVLALRYVDPVEINKKEGGQTARATLYVNV